MAKTSTVKVDVKDSICGVKPAAIETLVFLEPLYTSALQKMKRQLYIFFKRHPKTI